MAELMGKGEPPAPSYRELYDSDAIELDGTPQRRGSDEGQTGCSQCKSCCNELSRFTGMKEDDWLNEPHTTPMAVLHGRMHEELYVPEAEWRSVTKWIFIPVSPKKMAFDILVLVCIIYSCITVPYFTVFEAEERWSFWYDMDYVVMIIFIADCACNFNTAFLHQELWILHRPAIARQ
jgi:hypothetical protein